MNLPKIANTYWQTTSFETWPPAAASAERLLAETPKEAAKLLTPYGAYFAAQPQPEKLTASNEPKQVPQFLQPYGALQSNTQTNLLLLNSPYYAAYSLPLAYVAPSIAPAIATTPSTTTSTAKPTIAAEVEATEKAVDTIETLQKLQAKTQTSVMRSDEKLREIKNLKKTTKSKIGRINSNYVIEEIVAVPGKHVISSSQQLKMSTAGKLRSGKLRAPPVKVEATGRTSSSSKNFPQIPFGSYFLPYRPQQAKAIEARKQAALILEPHAKAVVGNGGTAISTPISRALLKKGVPTNVYFNPESVAIAGVGGKAHAAADLELDLHRSGPLIFEEQLPYYGGWSGQHLQLRPQQRQVPELRGLARDSDDTITISAASISAVADGSGNGISTISASGSNFNRIQEAAARLVAIQELAKRKGSFSEEDNKIYANSLLELGQAATALALLQQTGQIKDFSVLLQPELFGTSQKQPSNLGLEANNPADQKIDEQKLDEVTEQQLTPDEFLPPTSEDPYEDVNDSVAVMAPKKDAAVAEAKPVGLSIAGEGGVASSKPHATAISGRNGLAVASPKATAIAGVSPEEAAAFSITLPSRNQLVIKTPNSAGERIASDDYDYNDVPLAMSSYPHTRETPLRPGAGDSLVEKWRTAIAEEYAARSKPKTQLKTVIRAAPKRRLHYE
ncbi:hypothetical protein ACLKA7_017293 [Drosophila subpalustris]